MASKLLALASVTALTGIVAVVSAAGCSPESSNKSQVTTTEDPPDGGSSPSEGGTDGDGEAPAKPAADCMVTEPIDTSSYPYKSARVVKDACSTTELEDLTTFFAEHAREGFKVSEWAAVVSEQCADCVFSDGSGPTWTPILTQGEELETIDRGGCIEAVSGNEACGRAYQHTTQCLVDACYTHCKTAEEYFECLENTPAVFNGPCKGAYDQMLADCGSDLESYETACESRNFTFEGPVRVMCIEGGKPAGG